MPKTWQRFPLELFVLLSASILSLTSAYALQTRGLWVQIEERGWPVGYWPGQVIQMFNQFDPNAQNARRVPRATRQR